MEVQVLRHNGGVLHIESVEKIGLYPVHAVEGIVSDSGLFAVQPCRLGNKQTVRIAAICPEIKDGAQLAAADQKSIGICQFREITDG